ncbi:MAG: hypothetical protein ACI3WQ_00605 [Faecousia sp.]
MNGRDLLLAMDYVDEAYVAQIAPDGRRRIQKVSARKAVLIAAAAALALLLVGCAVVYVLNMQNLKLGVQEETKPVYGADGQSLVGYETVNQNILSLNGLKGTPGYQAALEWYRFKQEYDPDLQIRAAVTQEPEFPAEYIDYNLYTQEMKDRLDEIMTRYRLKPQGSKLDFRTVKNMCAALGVEKLQTARNDVTVKVDSGLCYSNGSFQLMLGFVLPPEEGSQIDSTWGILKWNRKDCFSEDYISIEDSGDWQEWNYTTASGKEVLIIRSPSDWRGWIFCDRGEATLSLQLEARRDLGYNEDGRTWFEHLYLTDRQMEQIADAIDFGIQPQLVSQEDMENQPGVFNAETQNGYTVELKSVETDGWIARITVGITAPEGTVISHNPTEGYENVTYNIEPANFYSDFYPVEGGYAGGSGAWNVQEDHDGLDNTQDIVLIRNVTMEDGSAPFSPGRVWKVRFEDLESSYWDSKKTTFVEETLVEGEWEFEITFGEENGDYREVELITEPITAKVAGGMRSDGSDAEETVEVTSFKLRKFGASIEHKGEEYFDFSYLNGKSLCAVMKDGSTIQLYGTSTLKAKSTIDLDQVDSIRFADGTVVPMPEK